jgi:KipI family sensor histidine kinase inhibitor
VGIPVTSSTPTILSAGERAVQVEFETAVDVVAFTGQLHAASPPQVIDVVPTELAVMIFAADGVTTSDLRQVITDCFIALGRDEGDERPTPSEIITIGVYYDGPDLDDLADISGLCRSEIIELHTEVTWTCSFIGFAPGFGYLSCPDHRVDAPRRAQSRPQVPCGTIGLARRYSANYPRSSPGGWQLIGSTDIPVWDPEATPPALLSAGTRVRFIDLGSR